MTRLQPISTAQIEAAIAIRLTGFATLVGRRRSFYDREEIAVESARSARLALLAAFALFALPTVVCAAFLTWMRRATVAN